MEGIMKLTKIFEPITINKTEFKNRMVVSAMVTNYCNEDGTPTEKFMAYHEHKAKGGYGIIITEDFAVTRTAGASKTLAGLWEDRQVEPWRVFTIGFTRQGLRPLLRSIMPEEKRPVRSPVNSQSHHQRSKTRLCLKRRVK